MVGHEVTPFMATPKVTGGGKGEGGGGVRVTCVCVCVCVFEVQNSKSASLTHHLTCLCTTHPSSPTQEVVPKRRKARRRKKGGEGKQESSGAKEAKDSAKQEEGVEGTDSVETKGARVCVLACGQGCSGWVVVDD